MDQKTANGTPNTKIYGNFSVHEPISLMSANSSSVVYGNLMFKLLENV